MFQAQVKTPDLEMAGGRDNARVRLSLSDFSLAARE